MKKFKVIILLIVFNCQLNAQQINYNDSNNLSKKLDEYLISMSNAYQFNGTVLVATKDKVILRKGYGWKDATTKTINEPNDIFLIGSNTKPFTATAILKLQEEGRLSIYDKLSKYFPDYRNGSKVTIENLLTHTSGIPGYNVDETDTVAWTPVSKTFILNLFEKSPLEFEPGTQYKYSNSGFFLLGMIIEKVTGKSYEQALKDMIFEPLQMTHTGFDFIHLKDTLKATGYSVFNNNEQRPAHLVDSTVSYSAGSMYSTVDDLYKWGKAIAAKEILSAGLWKKAFTPFKANYGYGWIIDSINGKNYVGHSGGTLGFTSYFLYFPKEDVFIILLNNFFNATNPIVLPVQDLSAIIFNKPYSLYHEEAKLSDSVLNNYVGVYTLSTNSKRTIVITKENKDLIATIKGSPSLRLIFETSTKFKFKGVPNTGGEFIMTGGKVMKMVVSQNGIFEWNKIK